MGPHAELNSCPYCQESRFCRDGQPRQTFTYIPLIPQLTSFAQNREIAEKMKYRAHEHKHVAGITSDVFDGTTYRKLCQRHVHVNGVQRFPRYFEDSRDVALGLSTDGFAPHKRRKKTAWPLILFNYNLPPDIRFHLEHILALGVIPGPNKPHDIDSFIWPLIQELNRLADGVAAYDILGNAMFSLRAFLIVVFGDIPAVSMLMHMKGHNAKSPCRMCKIAGIHSSGGKTNYVPLNRSWATEDDELGDEIIKVYEPAALPLRTHVELLSQATEVQLARTDAEADRLSRQYGIKDIPLLSTLDSLLFPISFPYDFMHLIWENLIKNLVLHWTGEFKGLDDGAEDYQLSKTVWDAIGVETAAAGSTIPSAYGARVPNIAKDKSIMSAEMWSFWTLYLGPILLRRRFCHQRYFIHFVLLVKLLNICLQFEITAIEIQQVCQGFVDWVQTYERSVSVLILLTLAEHLHRIYYQLSEDRVSACPLTVHALLHIADSIEAMGPVWCYWAFPME